MNGLKITGKFWLKSGSVVTTTEEITDDNIKEVTDAIQLIGTSFKNPNMLHAVVRFGSFMVRVDDCSAVWFKEVTTKK